MVIRDNGEIELVSENGNEDCVPSLEDDSEVEYAVQGEAFVIQRALNVQLKE